MRFSIENIGAIDSATVDIDGITIIAGENNVGKSTIGKALFAFLHDMSEWEKIYDKSCYLIIKGFLYQNSVWLEDFCMKNSGAKKRRTSKSLQLIHQYATDAEFRVALEDYQICEESDGLDGSDNSLNAYLKDYCLDYLSLYFKETKEKLSCLYANDLSQWITHALKELRQLNLSEVELQQNTIKQSLHDVFKGQYRKIGKVDYKISFTDEWDREIHFIGKDSVDHLDNPIRLTKNVYFVETPRIYDYISSAKFANDPKGYLRRMMVPNTFKTPITTTSSYSSTKDSVDDMASDLLMIIDHLTHTMGGRAEFYQKIGLEFKDRNIPETIHSVNVSTGLKSLALLEYALRIGAIERGDIMVLDEPEINLHPEWQLEYAKAIVELQKSYGIKFIITSHSPFFIRSIECYTDIKGTMDQLNVYRVSRSNAAGTPKVINVSYSEYGMSDLYEDLSAPLDKLDALLDEKYGIEDGEK